MCFFLCNLFETVNKPILRFICIFSLYHPLYLYISTYHSYQYSPISIFISKTIRKWVLIEFPQYGQHSETLNKQWRRYLWSYATNNIPIWYGSPQTITVNCSRYDCFYYDLCSRTVDVVRARHRYTCRALSHCPQWWRFCIKNLVEVLMTSAILTWYGKLYLYHSNLTTNWIWCQIYSNDKF